MNTIYIREKPVQAANQSLIPLIFQLVTVDPQVILKTKEGGAATSHNTCALMPRQEREGARRGNSAPGSVSAKSPVPVPT